MNRKRIHAFHARLKFPGAGVAEKRPGFFTSAQLRLEWIPADR